MSHPYQIKQVSKSRWIVTLNNVKVSKHGSAADARRAAANYATRSTSLMKNEQLYNCCTGGAAPDWKQFVALTIVGMADYDGRSEMAEPGSDINFWCVFAVDADRMFEPVTDCTTLAMAQACAAKLAEISNLPLETN